MHPRATLVVLILSLLLTVVSAGAQSTADSASGVAVPGEIPIFPLPEVMLFPGLSRPLLIFEPRYRAMVADALKGNRIIGMVALKPGYEANYEGRPPIYEIGCAGQIAEYQELPDGRYTIVLRGLVKFRVTGEDNRQPYRIARIDLLPEVPKDQDLAALSALRERVSTLLVATIPPGTDLPPTDIPDAAFINLVSAYLSIPETQRQDLLERPLLSRAQALIDILETR